MTQQFTLTYDYLCPFARIASETVIEALEDGADYDVTFSAFSLSQSHVDDGDPAAWDREPGDAGTRGVRALQWSMAVRSLDPGGFLDFHKGLFSARHDDAADVDDVGVLRQVCIDAGIDADAVADLVATGTPKKALAEEHTASVETWAVFGVPTFISGDEAVFVRFMHRHERTDLDRVLDMLDWTNVNEFKRTRIPR